jgi:hypothetical protein
MQYEWFKPRDEDLYDLEDVCMDREPPMCRPNSNFKKMSRVRVRSSQFTNHQRKVQLRDADAEKFLYSPHLIQEP